MHVCQQYHADHYGVLIISAYTNIKTGLHHSQTQNKHDGSGSALEDGCVSGNSILGEQR